MQEYCGVIFNPTMQFDILHAEIAWSTSTSLYLHNVYTLFTTRRSEPHVRGKNTC